MQMPCTASARKKAQQGFQTQVSISPVVQAIDASLCSDRQPCSMCSQHELQHSQSETWPPHIHKNTHLPAHTGSPACGDCVDITTTPPPGVNQRLTVPTGLNDTALEQLLQPFAAAKWLHLVDVPGMRLSFSSAARQGHFEAWLQRARVPWCCRGSGAAGGEDGSAAGAAVTGGDGAPVPVPMQPYATAQEQPLMQSDATA